MKTKCKSTIRAAYHSFSGAICAGAVLLMASSAQAQNLFVADWYSFHVYEYTPNGVQSTFASQMYGPVALAFNNSGDLYVGTMDGGGIIKVTPSGAKSTFASQAAISLAVNSAGNLFASGAAGNICEYTPDGTQTIFASGLLSPYGIAFNSGGDLFVADSYGANIIRIKRNGDRSTFATGVSGGQDLAFDSAGNLFVASVGTGNIYEYTPDGVQSTFASGLIHPFGLAFDNAGDLFVSDNGNGAIDSGKIYEFTQTGERSTFASGLGYGMPSGLAIQLVPEPSVLGLLSVCATALLVRRRRCWANFTMP